MSRVQLPDVRDVLEDLYAELNALAAAVADDIAELEGVDVATDSRLDAIEAVTSPQQPGIADPVASTQGGAMTGIVSGLNSALTGLTIFPIYEKFNEDRAVINAVTAAYNDLAVKHNALVVDHNALKDNTISLIFTLEQSGIIANT